MGDRVLLRSPAGSFLSVWRGPAVDVGTQVEVDLRVPEELAWGTDVAPALGSPLAAGWGPVLFIGRVERDDQGRASGVRLADDGSVSVRIEGVPDGVEAIEVVAGTVEAHPRGSSAAG